MAISTTTQYELALALRAALDDVEGGAAAPYERFKSLASHAGMLIAEGNIFEINKVAARAMTSAWMARQSADKLLDLLIIVGLAHRHGLCSRRHWLHASETKRVERSHPPAERPKSP